MRDQGTIRILLVGGEEADDRLIRRLLIEARRPEWGFAWLRSPDAAMNRLDQGECDVVLVGEFLERQSGLELTRQAKARGCRAAFVLLTAEDNRERQNEAARAGAMDTLPRQALTAALLDRVVRAAMDRCVLENQVREGEERFRTMAGAAPMPLYVKSADGRGAYFNQSWLEYRGRGMAQELGDGWQDGLDPVDREQTLALLANAMHQRVPFRIEYRLRRRDGEYRSMLDMGHPRFSAKGSFEGYVGILTEVSAHVRLEHDLARVREEAVGASQLKSQFIANISHELRTPMNGIIGMAGLLLDTPLTQEQRELAEAVQKSADALLGVVNDILDIAKIETGRLQVDAVELELRSLIEDTLALLSERAQDKGLELLCEIPADLTTLLRGDPGRLRQALANLVGNAIKFTEQGEVLVSVQRVEETESILVFRIDIKDTGIGITPEARKLIFQPFVQADGTSTRRHGGMGLGLTISRQLVELMGGRLGLESEIGVGSTFWIELSLPKLIEGAPAKASLPKLLPSVSVLVVNTSATNRRVLLNQLTDLGVSAAACETGAEAFSLMRTKALAGHPFDIAIVDRLLPGFGSRQLARDVRADSAVCSTALVLATTANHLAELQGFKQSGFDAILLKPIRQRQLRQCVQKLSARPSRGRSHARVEEETAGFELPPTRRGGLRVLIVEDNFVNQKVAQRHMEKLGHHADVAENGAQALDMLALQRYDVVLMDCQMPVLDGYDTTRRIRAGRVPNLDPGLPVIAFTAYATEEDRQRCTAAGMDDFIAKPFRFEDFQTVLERRVVKRDGRHVITSDSQVPFATKPPVLDRSRLDHLYGKQEGDEEFICTLIDLFLAETPRKIEELRSARGRGDLRVIGKIASTVQGAAANLGARALEQHCLRLESAAQGGRQADLESLIAGLDEELARLALALDKQRQKAPFENPHR